MPNFLNYSIECKCFEICHRELFNPFIKLGYILLMCSLGCKKFESFDIALKTIDYTKCCLYHNILNIEYPLNKFNVGTFIEKRNSSYFVDFICMCTNYNNIDKELIYYHEWFKIINVNKIKISTKELIKAAKINKKHRLTDVKKLQKLFLKKFYNIVKTYKNGGSETIQIKKTVLKEICSELEININELCNKLGINLN